MLFEESAVFAQDANDIACIPSLKKKTISVKDEIPVQRANTSVPKKLAEGC